MNTEKAKFIGPEFYVTCHVNPWARECAYSEETIFRITESNRNKRRRNSCQSSAPRQWRAPLSATGPHPGPHQSFKWADLTHLCGAKELVFGMAVADLQGRKNVVLAFCSTSPKVYICKTKWNNTRFILFNCKFCFWTPDYTPQGIENRGVNNWPLTCQEYIFLTNKSIISPLFLLHTI